MLFPLLSSLFISCAPSRAASTIAVVASTVVSLAVNSSGDAVCVPSNSSMAAYFSRAAIRGQTGHGWFEAPVRIASAAFQGGAWWLALPRAGVVQKADGVPQSIAVVGQPSRLSSRFIFTLEGDVFRYDGSKLGRLPSLPTQVLETKDSSFALVGKEVYSLGTDIKKLRQLENSQVSLLESVSGVEVVAGVAVRQGNLTYTLEKEQIKISNNNQALQTVRLAAAGSGLAVGGDTLAVAIGASVAFFDARTFVPLVIRACEVTR